MLEPSVDESELVDHARVDVGVDVSLVEDQLPHGVLEHAGMVPLHATHLETLTYPHEDSVLEQRILNGQLLGYTQCFLYATGGDVPGTIWLTSEHGAPNDKLSVAQLFPNGAVSMRVIEMPGTNQKLAHDWRIIISSNVAPSPPNQTILHLYGCVWNGNIVLAKYSRKEKKRFKLNKVQLAELPFADHILYSWLLKYDKFSGEIFGHRDQLDSEDEQYAEDGV